MAELSSVAVCRSLDIRLSLVPGRILKRNIYRTEGKYSRKQSDQAIHPENILPNTVDEKYCYENKRNAMEYSLQPVCSSNITFHDVASFVSFVAANTNEITIVPSLPNPTLPAAERSPVRGKAVAMIHVFSSAKLN